MKRSVLNHANAAGLAIPSAAPAHTQTGKSVVKVSVTFSRVERWPGREMSPEEEEAVETTGLCDGWQGRGGGRRRGKRRKVEVSKKKRSSEKRTEEIERAIIAAPISLLVKSPSCALWDALSKHLQFT